MSFAFYSDTPPIPPDMVVLTCDAWLGYTTVPLDDWLHRFGNPWLSLDAEQ